MAASVFKGKPLQSVAALEKLTLGNDFILRIAEERSRQAVERAETLDTLLQQSHAENEALRAGVGIASGVESQELRARIAELQADAVQKDRDLAELAATNKHSVPSAELQKVLGEMQAAQAAAQLAATATRMAEALSSERAEALSSKRAEVTAHRDRIAHLEADIVTKGQELAEVMAFNDVDNGDTVPLEQYEKAVAELAAEHVAHAADREQADQALSVAQAGCSELQRCVAQLEADGATKEQELADAIAFSADSVPLDKHETVVGELQAEQKAHAVAAAARQVVEQALSAEQTESAALRSQLAAEKAAAEEATTAVKAQLKATESATAKDARAAEGEADDLRSRLAAAQQASGDTGQQASVMLEENLSLRAELREAMEQKESSSKEVEAAMAEVERIMLQLDDASAAHDVLMLEHAQTQELHAEVSQELEQLRVQAAAAEVSYEDLLSARIGDIEAKVAEIAQLKQSLKEQGDEVAMIVEFGMEGVLVPMDEHEETLGVLKQELADEQAKAAMGASEREAQSEREVTALKEAAVLAATEAQDAQQKLREDSMAQVSATMAVQSAIEAELKQTKEQLVEVQGKLARRSKVRASEGLEPESELTSPVEMTGLARSVRAFCIEQADDFIAAAIGRLVQLGATGTEGIFVSSESI